MAPTRGAVEHVTVGTDDGDLDLAYRVAGGGPPLVCVHGIGLDAATVGWRHAPDALAEHFSVYRLDLPNHGESDTSRTVRTTADYIAVFERFLDALDLRGGTFAGLSMGGAVVLGHALDGGDPDRLVLVDSYGLGGDAPWRTAAGLAVRMPFADGLLTQSLSSRSGVRSTLSGLVGNGLSDGLVADVQRVTDADSLGAMRRWQRHEFRHDGLRTDYRDGLADLDVPTLLIHGERDPLLPVEWSAQAHERLPHSELLGLPDVGHWPPRERTETVFEAIETFTSGN